jgi:hypothetical protein
MECCGLCSWAKLQLAAVFIEQLLNQIAAGVVILQHNSRVFIGQFFGRHTLENSAESLNQLVNFFGCFLSHNQALGCNPGA